MGGVRRLGAVAVSWACPLLVPDRTDSPQRLGMEGFREAVLALLDRRRLGAITSVIHAATRSAIRHEPPASRAIRH